MKSLKKTVGAILLVVAVLFLVGSCTRWKWNECRKVGHGIAYCIIKQGE